MLLQLLGGYKIFDDMRDGISRVVSVRIPKRLLQVSVADDRDEIELVIRILVASNSGREPEGALIDFDMSAYYTWLDLSRLMGAEQARFLVWFEINKPL